MLLYGDALFPLILCRQELLFLELRTSSNFIIFWSLMHFMPTTLHQILFKISHTPLNVCAGDGNVPIALSLGLLTVSI